MNVKNEVKPKKFLAVGKIEEYADLLKKLKIAVTCHVEDECIGYDGIIIFGGDGTVLRTLSRYKNPPIVYAINCGKVGFLCPITCSEIDELARKLETGEKTKYFELKRLCLVPDKYFLNEAVIRSQSPERLNTFKVCIDNVTFVIRADAIIISTKAGSSGYNMSVGGPILLSEGIVVNAIAPNRCNFRPIVCELGSKIRVEIDDKNSLIIIDGIVIQEKNFEVFCDGSGIKFCYLSSYDKSRYITSLFLSG